MPDLSVVMCVYNGLRTRATPSTVSSSSHFGNLSS